ncbi:MAG: sigma-70 family RNA polymerase sigma factor [Actinomycetota bacterium]|nr:sigma-70 family RNA polymerase sigma factor [Actinomycetota bacterium]
MPDAFDTYLRRTIVNLFTSQLRRRRVERAYVARQQRSEPTTVPADDPALRDELWRSLATLPSRQRAAVVLRYYEDLSERETAQILGVSTGAASQLIVRAMTTLRDHVRGDDA